MFDLKITIVLLYFCVGIAKLHISTDCLYNKFVRYKHKGSQRLHICDWWLRTIVGTQCVQEVLWLSSCQMSRARLQCFIKQCRQTGS